MKTNFKESRHPQLIALMLERLAADPVYGRFVNTELPVPQNHVGSGEIKLVVLGQDPTIHNRGACRFITTALNLDKSGSLRTYLLKICAFLVLGLDENIFATNLYKNFFVQQPTQIKEVNVFSGCLPYWLPVLQEELAQYQGVPVLTLGEPLLRAIVCDEVSCNLRDYWGHTVDWKKGLELPFRVLPAHQNILGRLVFPFPHQPTWQKQKFYSDRLQRYSAFVREMV